MGNEPLIGDRHDELRLVRRMAGGDRSAFDTFVATYTPVLVRYAQVHLRHHPEAMADVIQTTLVAAIERLESFRGEGPLGAWLVGICRFQVGTFLRRRQVRDRWATDGTIDLDQLEAPENLQSETLEQRELTATIHSTLDLLPPPYGDILEWKYLEELPVKTIAQRLELSPKAAESLLTRARRSFRRVFALSAGRSGES